MKICVFLLTGTALVAHAANTRATESRLQHAKALYYQAVDGENGAAQSSELVFQQLAAARPNDALITSYLGGLRLLEARRTLAVWRKGKLNSAGTRVTRRGGPFSSARPRDPILRASATFHLPDFVSRAEQCRSDFATLVGSAEEAVREGTFDRRLAAAAFYFHGVLLDRASDRNGAQAAFRNAVRMSPGSNRGLDAPRKLDERR